jgi:signal transduction histidine kinase
MTTDAHSSAAATEPSSATSPLPYASSPFASSWFFDLTSGRDLIELLPLAAYAVRAPDGMILWFNSRAADLWGRTPVAGDSQDRFCGAHKLYHPDGSYMAHGDTPVAVVLETGVSVQEEEMIIERPDGSRVTVSVHVDAVRDDDGKIIGAVNFLDDVTARKQFERELRESKRQLSAHTENLEAEVRARTRELENRNDLVVQQSNELRELTLRLLQSQDEERRRIARELHDSVGQIVSAIAMTLSSAIHRARIPRVEKAVEESLALIHQLSAEIRTISYLLHPPLLDEIGLSKAIEWYVKGLAERSGIRIELEFSETFGRLPLDIETALFRIVQECLTNIHRHSDSKTAVIRLWRTEQAVFLEVQDRGKGIPARKISEIQNDPSGVGLAGIRERVRHLEGVLDIQSNGDGTKIAISFPNVLPREKESTDSLSAAG